MKERILDFFRFDLRLLGIFRIFLGLLICIDLINRLKDLRIFYTDDGVIPRNILIENNWAPWNFSLNMISGAAEFQWLLFGLGIFCALLLTIGYKTKWCLGILFILIISIQTRNPEIFHSGDGVLRLIVFYALFLPINSRYAIDKIAKKSLPASGTILSIATVAYLFQTIYIYVFSAIEKTGDTWSNGTAIYYALEQDSYARSFSHFLTDLPELTSFLTYSTFYLEKYGFLLLFIPIFWKYFRLLGVLLFMGFHFGLFVFMDLGMFPWAAIIMWIIVLPPMAADFIEKKTQKLGLYRYLSEKRNTLRSKLENNPINWSIIEQPFKRIGWVPSIFLGFVAVGVLMWNLSSVTEITCPKPLKQLVRITATYQAWAMFAPNPRNRDGWFVMDAQLTNGNHIDILNERDIVDFKKPEDVLATYKNERWKQWLTNRWSTNSTHYQRTWGKYYCSCWNKKNGNTPKELESLSIYFMKEITNKRGEPKSEIEKVTIWNHWCKESFKSRFD